MEAIKISIYTLTLFIDIILGYFKRDIQKLLPSIQRVKMKKKKSVKRIIILKSHFKKIGDSEIKSNDPKSSDRKPATDAPVQIDL